MNKTKSNKKKSGGLVSTLENVNWTGHTTPALFGPVSRCVGLCREHQEQDTAQLCSGGFGQVSEEPAKDNIGLPPKPSEAGSVGKGGAAK